MIQAITPNIHNQLLQIGFDDDEINTFKKIHELKAREYTIDIKGLINKIAFENLTRGISQTFEKNKWSDQDFYVLIEQYRNDKKKW